MPASTSTSTSNRNTIFLEDARVISQTAFSDEQFILRVHAPKCAAHAKAGSFAHVTCDPLLPMRRPLSIMQVDANEGWVDFLYKIVGEGLRLLASRVEGEVISVLGPIGKPFKLNTSHRRPLLLGGGVGIPPMVFLADSLRTQSDFSPVLFMGSEVPFPFELVASSLDLPGIDASVGQTIKLIEDWNIPARLATLQGYAGCFNGYVTQAAAKWLDTLSTAEKAEVEIFACGPTPMLEACAKLAKEYDLPAQVSLEEHMACAVGGCAGCTVLVETPTGSSMQRVCVDGPVFNAYEVFPAA
ncbi:MAG: dihydroorotate dehydrogenase electron transfer subunit [Gammaproteobacteria bacterium]